MLVLKANNGIKILKISFIGGLIFYFPFIPLSLLSFLGLLSSDKLCGSDPSILCGFILGHIFLFGILVTFLISGSISFFHIIFSLRKLKFPRLLLIVSMSAFTFFSFMIFIVLKGLVWLAGGLYILLLYPLIYYSYHWLFNIFLPKISK